MQNKLEVLVKRNKKRCLEGRVADYIPGLNKANEGDLGICIIKEDNSIYAAGDCSKKFTIQSVSKPFALILAILDRGMGYVFSKVGMESTGDAFNSIVKLETCTDKKPYNPMINAGAIAVTSMIKGRTSQEKFQRLLTFMRTISENEKLSFNREIYEDEKNTGDRNRALAYFQKGEGIIEGDVEESLDLYFRQCSIEVTPRDLAQLGIFLARGGRLTNGEIAVDKSIIQVVNSIILTCGMYDGSGEFAARIGIPSKSGVGGGILSFLPNRVGIGVYGPALDKRGNSSGGIALLEDLSKEFSLNIFS